MDKDLIKAVVGLVASAGVSKILTNAIKATTPYDSGKLDKVIITVGSIVVTGVASNYAIQYTNDQVDFAYKAVHNLKNGNTDFIVGETTDEQ